LLARDRRFAVKTHAKILRFKTLLFAAPQTISLAPRDVSL
jgi:hypothetical protein